MTFRNTTKKSGAKILFVALTNIPKDKNRQVLTYLFVALYRLFFFLGRFGLTGGLTGAFCCSPCWSSSKGKSNVSSQRSTGAAGDLIASPCPNEP